MRRATKNTSIAGRITSISIHALLAESDRPQPPKARVLKNFYPRSPCGERPFMTLRHCTTYLFLSTLSLRRATLWVLRKVPMLGIFLSTLSLRRATQTAYFLLSDGMDFYPRSPCGERLVALKSNIRAIVNFYPRSPCGERQVVPS